MPDESPPWDQVDPGLQKLTEAGRRADRDAERTGLRPMTVSQKQRRYGAYTGLAIRRDDP